MKSKKMFYALPIFILAIVMAGFVAIEPVNSLTMDVNPSIELVTTRLDRVVEINPLNKDAKELLDGFNPKDKNLENTVSDLVDLMILTGHIKGGEDNFVMLTVEDDSMDDKLVKKVNRAIAAMLENKQIEATVLNQAISRNEKREKQTGVELAAQRLYKLDDDITMEEIGDMTVRELVHYSREKNIPIESLFRVASGNIEMIKDTKNIISKEEAEKIALGVVDGKILKVELDDLYDDDDPEYEIEILAKYGKYEIEIDAYTGKVVEVENDDDDSDDYYKNNDNKVSTKKEDPIKQPDKSIKTRISADKAKAIALDLVGGGTITEFESDDDEYEIEIKRDGIEYEIEIHAYTGKVLDFEVEDKENDHDDDDDDDDDEDDDDED